MSDLVFPDYDDPHFQEKIAQLEEFQILSPAPTPHVATLEAYKERVDQYCGGFEKMLYQHLVQQYLSHRTPYRGLLLYHGLGSGKTCSAITIAEGFLAQNVIHTQRKDDAPIWVVLPTTLQDGFQQEIFQSANLLKDTNVLDQCTGDTYRRMVFPTAKNADVGVLISKLIAKRYKMMTYEGFAKEVEEIKKKGVMEEVLTNKVIIIDEAHNLRTEETDKRYADALMEVATVGVNTRIVLLSATPMYDKADEILWLLSVLMANDGRKFPIRSSLFQKDGTRNEENFKILRQLATEYISYIKGTNPFTFAVRLSPKDSNIPIYTRPSWSKNIRDGLIASPMSEYQIQSMANMKSGATSRQAANICYPSHTKVAEKGFFSIFQRVHQQDPLQVNYLPAHMNALQPGEKLSAIAPKIDRICSLIRKSEGIVVIYSQYIWNGVIPMAIALEHMGFQRYGARNILQGAAVDRISYPDIPVPTYCILSGDRTVMGGEASIADIVRKLKTRSNIHGQNIKVVIMSPVAGEGLSLRNVREVHVLDPWYHFNLLEQVIGRAIRTCSHTTLPVEERNVTVFLHALTNGKEDTVDLRSYEIAATKLAQTEEVQALIRDHAMDCPLLKSVNYIPMSTFGFDVILRTSQGVAVPYHFGDQENQRPKCPSGKSKEANNVTMRKEVYQHLVPTGLQRLRKFLLSRPAETAWRPQVVMDALQLYPPVARMVLAEAIESHEFVPGFRLLEHRGILRKVSIPTEMIPSKVVVSKVRQVVKTHDKMDTIAQKSTKDSIVAIIDIYKAFEPASWDLFAKSVLEYGNTLPTAITRHVELLANEGAFIRASELSNVPNATGQPYIGYILIFDITDLKGIVFDTNQRVFRELLPSEVETLKKKRREVQRPKTGLYGYLEPQSSKGGSTTFEIKLWRPEDTIGKRRGVVCSSLLRGEIAAYLEELKPSNPQEKEKKATKDGLCLTLAEVLFRNKRLLVYPLWKPI